MGPPRSTCREVEGFKGTAGDSRLSLSQEAGCSLQQTQWSAKEVPIRTGGHTEEHTGDKGCNAGKCWDKRSLTKQSPQITPKSCLILISPSFIRTAFSTVARAPEFLMTCGTPWTSEKNGTWRDRKSPQAGGMERCGPQSNTTRDQVLALPLTSHVNLRKLQVLQLQSMSGKPHLWDYWNKSSGYEALGRVTGK